VPKARRQFCHVLRLEIEVRRDGEVSDIAKLRGLEDENRRLKRLLADSALEIDALKLIASGNF
jgi:hypothetical protein